jgi:hypothetical protein
MGCCRFCLPLTQVAASFKVQVLLLVTNIAMQMQHCHSMIPPLLSPPRVKVGDLNVRLARVSVASALNVQGAIP